MIRLLLIVALTSVGTWPLAATGALAQEPDVVSQEPQLTSLSEALASAYRTNPTLEAERYELRATDENLAQAYAELRPTADLQVTGGYSKIVPGRVTQANRSPADRLASPNIISNTLGAEISAEQPLYTGGRASADIAAASADIRAAREGLRGVEGDLLLQTIATYVGVRRDANILDIRRKNLTQLETTLGEVQARREAGELTRTDIAQAMTQLAAARAQTNAAEAQEQASRAAFAALVGSNPGDLAPEPPLPKLPASIDEAFAVAEQGNPELARAIYTEHGSRERIAAARAQGRPTLSLRGSAALSGRGVPFDVRDDDQEFTGQAVLRIPLLAGGRIRSQIAQAGDRNAADQMRIEAARREVVQRIAEAWNQVVTAQRNLEVQHYQLEAARVFYDGSFEEYRAGLRSTFDVLYAQGTLRDTEIAVLTTEGDLYVAKSTLLRRLGLLEAQALLTSVTAYDPEVHVKQIKSRIGPPWDVPLRALDRLGKPSTKRPALRPVPVPSGTPAIRPAERDQLPVELITTSPTSSSLNLSNPPRSRNGHR